MSLMSVSRRLGKFRWGQAPMIIQTMMIQPETQIILMMKLALL